MVPPPDEFDQVLSAEMRTAVRAWRAAHPRVPLREIEAALDAHLARVRAALLQEAALSSPAADWTQVPPDQQPVCPDCQLPLAPRGAHTRQLTSHHDQPVRLSRQYGTCPQCGRGFFPPR
jgi:hypothetical protein